MRFIPNIPQFGGGGGPTPPPSSQDRFAPKYLVGNVLEGDNATPYNSGGFQYIPDTGDGEGIRAAIAAASLAKSGDVWIRPGTYTLAADALPFVIEDDILVRGAGTSTTIRRTATTTTCAIFGLAGDGATLRDVYLRVETTSEFTNDARDGSVVIASGGSLDKPVQLENVNILLTTGVGGTFPVSGIYNAASLLVDRCSVLIEGQPCGDPRIGFQGAAAFRSVRKSRARIDASGFYVYYFTGVGAAAALGYPLAQDPGTSGGDISFSQCEFYASAGATVVGFGCDLTVTNSRLECSTQANDVSTGIYLRSVDSQFPLGDQSTICLGNSQIRVRSGVDTFGTPSIGIDADVRRGQITGNTIQGDSGVISSGTVGLGMTIGFNSILAQPNQHLTLRSPDEAAHNIFESI